MLHQIGKSVDFLFQKQEGQSAQRSIPFKTDWDINERRVHLFGCFVHAASVSRG